MNSYIFSSVERNQNLKAFRGQKFHFGRELSKLFLFRCYRLLNYAYLQINVQSMPIYKIKHRRSMSMGEYTFSL